MTTHNTCEPGQTKPMEIIDLDSVTGDWRWRITATSTYMGPSAPPLYCYPGTPRFALRHDGIIAIATPGNTSGLPELMMINALTGALVWSPSIPQSSFADFSGGIHWGYSRIGPPMVDGQGAIYVMYETRHVSDPPQVDWATLWLLKINLDNTTTTTQVTTTTDNVNLFPGRLIPVNDDAIVATWTITSAAVPANPDPNPLRAAHISAGGAVTEYTLPVQPTSVQMTAEGIPAYLDMLLGENNRVFASYGTDLQAFNAATGGVAWTYAAAQTITPLVADSAGGVSAKIGEIGASQTLIQFNQSGGSAPGGVSGDNVQFLAGAYWMFGSAISVAAVQVGPFVSEAMGGFARYIAQLIAQKKPSIVVTPDLAPDAAGQDFIGDILGEVHTKLQAEAASPKHPCSDWLTNPVDPRLRWNLFLPTYLAPHPEIANGRMYGHGKFDQVTWGLPTILDEETVAARNGTNPNPLIPNGIPAGWFIAMNNNGAYYKTHALPNGPFKGAAFTSRVSGYKPTSPRFRAETLIHELAHVFLSADALPEPHKTQVGFLSDFKNDPAQNANARMIRRHCRALIESFPQ